VMKRLQDSSKASSMWWSWLQSKILFKGLSCSFNFDMILTQAPTVCSSMRMCSDNVRVSSHFGNEIILSRNYRKENEMEHLVGLTRRHIPIGVAESEFPLATSRVTIHFSFTSQMTVAPTGRWFAITSSDFLLCINISPSLLYNSDAFPRGHGDKDPTMSGSENHELIHAWTTFDTGLDINSRSINIPSINSCGWNIIANSNLTLSWCKRYGHLI
jgi:hypothetical protein